MPTNKTKKQKDKIRINFRLNDILVRALKKEAIKENCSLNSYVETILTEAVFNTPNTKIIETIQEVGEKNKKI